MKIRYGLVLAMAVGLGITACASGGGGGGGGTGIEDLIAAGGGGVPPRETDMTDQAEEALKAAEEAGGGPAAQSAYQQALTAADSAVAEDPENPLAHRLAGLANLGLKNYQEAGEHFDRASELYPLYEFEDATLREQAWIDLYNQGAPLINQGEYEEAVQIFENANAIYAERPEAFVTLGQLYAQLRQHDRALANLDSAVAIINSENTQTMDSATVAGWREQEAQIPLLRAQILSDAGRFEEATGVFRQMIADNPDNLEARRNLAATLLQMGNTEQAFGVYDSLLARPNLRPVDYYTVGLGFYQGNAYARAADAFEKAVAGNPMDRDGIEMWARSLQLDSAHAEIPPVAERWMELDPYNQNAYLVLAQAVNINGDSQRAGQIIEQIDQLEVQVNDLLMTRYNNGGARVSGSLANKTLQQGTPVTLTFTFYDYAGDPMGTVTADVQAGASGMSELFNVEFDSPEQVGGYSYELTTG